MMFTALTAVLAALPLVSAAVCPAHLVRARVHPKGHKDKCLAIEAEAKLPYKFGQWIQIRDCKDQQGFYWLVDSRIETGGIMKLEGTGDVNWCLNAGTIYHVRWFPRDGTEAQLAYCGGPPDPLTEVVNRVIRWTFNNGRLTYSSGTTENFFCLDNEGGKLTEGNKVQIWECFDGNPNQQWEIEYLS